MTAGGDVLTTPPIGNDVRGNAAEGPKPRKVADDFGSITKHRLPWGVSAVFLWLLLFAVGVLIPSEPSRKILGWESQSASNPKVLESRVSELEKAAKLPKPGEAVNPTPVNAGTPGKTLLVANLESPPASAKASGEATLPPTPNQDSANSGKQSPEESPPAGKRQSKKQPSKLKHFIIAAFTFIPLNIGLLCVLAAFIGGCSINKNEIRRIQQQIFDLEANPPVHPNPEITRLQQRLDYLTEHPGYSTIRGLVVYLIIISGLFIIGAPFTGENGNHTVSLEQYMKLAGLFSFFGYLSGYDPTVFTSVIGIGSKHLNTVKPNP